MAKKIGYTILTWFLAVFAYIIMAATMPAFNLIVDQSSTNLQSTSNMSNYPGLLGSVESAPVYIWFIPGAVALIATIVLLKTPLLDEA